MLSHAIALFVIIVVSAIIWILRLNWLVENFNAGENYTAVIVEPRKHPALKFVLNNACENLSSAWQILVLRGKQNEDFVNSIIQEMPEKYRSRIKVDELPVDNLSIEEYNKLLTSREFYDRIPTDIFLIFQTDSLICKDSNIQIDEFFEYDYVGAPWAHLNGAVGNGGFSLRRKSKMIEILEKCKYNETDPEDIYFANACDKVSIHKPSTDKASKFSNEGTITENSFGIHKSWLYSDKDKFDKKVKNCAGADELAKLNGQ
jgi:hypothetical protein